MKNYYKRLLKANNAVSYSAPAFVWGKGVPGKGWKTTNFEIPEWMFEREYKELIVDRKA